MKLDCAQVVAMPVSSTIPLGAEDRTQELFLHVTLQTKTSSCSPYWTDRKNSLLLIKDSVKESHQRLKLMSCEHLRSLCCWGLQAPRAENDFDLSQQRVLSLARSALIHLCSSPKERMLQHDSIGPMHTMERKLGNNVWKSGKTNNSCGFSDNKRQKNKRNLGINAP